MRHVAVAAALAILTMSTPAYGSNPSLLLAGHEEFSERLGLTPDQEARVGSIIEKHIEALLETLEEYDVDVADIDDIETINLEKMRVLRGEIRERRAAIEKQLSGVLAETQMAEFRHIRAELEERVRNRLLSRRLDRVAAKLEFTPEQTELVRPILLDQFEEQRAILDRRGIDLGINGDGDRPGLLTLLALRRDLREADAITAGRLSAILSEQQLEAFEELAAEMRETMRKLLIQR